MLKLLSKLADDILLVLGVVFLVVGVYKIYVPAGYIVLGICFIIFGYLFAKNKEGDDG